MNYSTFLPLLMSILLPAFANHRRSILDILTRHGSLLLQDVLAFLSEPVTPTTTLDFEHKISARLREIGRALCEFACNQLEGDDPNALPRHILFEAAEYRILNKKTHQQVDGLFGPMHVRRHLYRPVDKQSGESVIAPLMQSLGVVANTTPALAEVIGRHLAATGSTQKTVQDRVRKDHGVTIGTQRLRELAGHLSEKMRAVRQEFQIRRLLELLEQANRSRGNRKPVLSVGRDGITLREYDHSLYEVASTGTVTVLDRAGKPLGSVYLAFAPELGQSQMTDQMTGLIEGVLRDWEGPLPRLAYVTDAGDNEVRYYERVLRGMIHPRTGEKLAWQRVVDFYHAMERVWTMAGVLFGEKSREAKSWARKMGGLLKKPNGPFRVLHSAAALRAGRKLSPANQKAYRQAYNYIRERTEWMQYHEYKKQHLPIGSGITEAACKTIFTQRLKLSGMRWSKAGAQVILDLRVVLLSGIWDKVYRHVLMLSTYNQLRIPEGEVEMPMQMAA